MHTESIEPWVRDHTFGQNERQPGEKRTWIVIGITLAMMAVEILAGMYFGSMALLADGLHMGSHASALAVSAFAYFYTRRHAMDKRFNFGTGKVNSLAAFASSLMLMIFSFFMAWESGKRFLYPVKIEFSQAILVAVAGLIVNAVCMAVLGGYAGKHRHSHSHHDEDAHHHDGKSSGDDKERHENKVNAKHDLNLSSAYIHVAADALTSFCAIFALLGGKYFGWNFLDPAMGIVGALLILRWSVGLLRSTSSVLLDMKVPDKIEEAVKTAVEAEGDNRIADLHVWAIGPGVYALEMTVVASDPMSAEEYYALLPKELGIAHFVVEARLCCECNAKKGNADKRAK